MCDGTRPFDGAAETSASYAGEWLDECTSLADLLAILRQQDEWMACSFLFPEMGAQDPYFGCREVAEFLDVKPRTVNQWGFRRRLPEPDLVLHATRLWKRSTILRWAGETGRLSCPALRSEYEERWKVEPVQRRRGGRIPQPPTPICGLSPRAAEPTVQTGAAVSMTASVHHVDRGIGHV